jgi:hypothetical protein
MPNATQRTTKSPARRRPPPCNCSQMPLLRQLSQRYSSRIREVGRDLGCCAALIDCVRALSSAFRMFPFSSSNPSLIRNKNAKLETAAPDFPRPHDVSTCSAASVREVRKRHVAPFAFNPPRHSLPDSLRVSGSSGHCFCLSAKARRSKLRIVCVPFRCTVRASERALIGLSPVRLSDCLSIGRLWPRCYWAGGVWAGARRLSSGMSAAKWTYENVCQK